MRMVSGVLYIASCFAAAATCMFPLYMQNGITYMTYSDIWGTIYLGAVAVGIFCMLFHKDGLMLASGLVATLLAGLKYAFLALEIDNSRFASEQAAQYSTNLAYIDHKVGYVTSSFAFDWNFYMFLAAAGGMLLFGLIYFMHQPVKNY